MPASAYVQRLRAAVGHELLHLPGVAVIIHDPEGRLLLVRNATSDGWGLPAGGIEPGESPIAAAKRELFEETGLVGPELALVAGVGGAAYRHTYPNGDRVEYATFVFVGTTSGRPRVQDQTEIAEAAYFSRDEAPRLEMPYPEELLWHD